MEAISEDYEAIQWTFKKKIIAEYLNLFPLGVLKNDQSSCSPPQPCISHTVTALVNVEILPAFLCHGIQFRFTASYQALSHCSGTLSTIIAFYRFDVVSIALYIITESAVQPDIFLRCRYHLFILNPE